MTIEFRCNVCDKTLRVADEYQGRKVKCPGCANVQVVEGMAPATPPLAVPNSSPSSAPLSPAFDNPYSSPQSPAFQENRSTQIQNNVPAIGEIFDYAFKVWKENLLMMIVAVLIVFGISIGMSIVSQIAQAIGQALAQQLDNQLVLLAAIGVSTIVTQVVQIFIGIGTTKFFLQILRGGQAELGLIFQGADRLLPIIGFSFLVGLAFLALIIPGIILMVLCWPAYYLIIDRKTPVMESFGLAREITKGNIGNTVLLFAMGMGITLIGLLALCVGIFAAQPLVVALWGTGYLMMSGQLRPQGLQETTYMPA